MQNSTLAKWQISSSVGIALVVMLAAMFILGTGAYAQDTASQFVSFDAPHPNNGTYGGTPPTAINRYGWIVGTVTYNLAQHGFVRKRNGSFVTFDLPGSRQTFVAAINANDEIVGSYYTAANTSGFLRDAAGNYTQITYPGTYSTNLSGINGTGVVVGFASLTGSTVAFLWDAQNGFTPFAVPWATTNTTIPLAINGAGSVTGRYDSDQPHQEFYSRGFVRNRNGGYAPFVAVDGSTQTEGVATNASGQTTGYANDGMGDTYGFLRDADGTVNIIYVSGSPGTTGTALNDSGVVVGNYFSDAGPPGAFVRDTSGNITNLGTELPFCQHRKLRGWHQLERRHRRELHRCRRNRARLAAASVDHYARANG